MTVNRGMLAAFSAALMAMSGRRRAQPFRPVGLSARRWRKPHVRLPIATGPGSIRGKSEYQRLMARKDYEAAALYAQTHAHRCGERLAV